MASTLSQLLRGVPRSLGPLVLRCRLCWRITLAVFLGIVAIEGAILVPSVVSYEQDRLKAITETGRELIASALTGSRLVADQAVRARLERVLTSKAVAGLELTTPGGEQIAVGEALQSDPSGYQNLRQRRDRMNGDRMEVAYGAADLGVNWSVQARLNTEGIDAELRAFVLRIMGLTLLIATFVTVVTMAVLGYLVLNPLLRLQARMVAAANDPDEPREHRSGLERRDELGALARAFNELLEIVHQRLSEIRALNADLDRRVAERTQELEAEIADRREAEARAKSLARFPEENVNPVLRVDSQCCLTFANSASEPLLAYWQVSVGERVPSQYCRVIESAMASGEPDSEEVFDGKRWFLCTVAPIVEEGYANIYGTDITERKQYEETLQQLAYRDSLTDLPNRNAFTEALEQALADCRDTELSTAVLFLGLDGFRTISGTAGHDASDKLLQEIAQRLDAAVPKGATLARLGGDVFAVLIPGCSRSEIPSLETAGRRLIETVDRPVTVDSRQLRCGASVGISVFPQDADDAANLGKNADLALYRAKQSGGNAVAWFDEALLRRAQWRQERAQGLRRALDQGELVLHYQPQLDTAAGLVGVEALMRWHAPDEGLVSPGDFIPVAEETGLITPMGDWALEAACAQARAWRDGGGPQVTVAVNLAAPHLVDTGLPQRLQDLLAQYGLPADALELEVTESAVMADMATAVDVLHRLRELGVTLAVDDFGTGYSSLAYLKQLPVHRVKIDRAFVMNLPEDSQDAALCRAILELGRSLDLAVVAEGVETAEQFAWLRARGCDIFQGFYFAKPMPAEALAGWQPPVPEAAES